MGKLRVVALLFGILLSCAVASFGAEDDWLAMFDDVCSQSNDAMARSENELVVLLERCGQLQKIIETKDETVKKVYLKRLELCRNLYAFVLEEKRQERLRK